MFLFDFDQEYLFAGYFTSLKTSNDVIFIHRRVQLIFLSPCQSSTNRRHSRAPPPHGTFLSQTYTDPCFTLIEISLQRLTLYNDQLILSHYDPCQIGSGCSKLAELCIQV